MDLNYSCIFECKDLKQSEFNVYFNYGYNPSLITQVQLISFTVFIRPNCWDDFGTFLPMLCEKEF